MGSRQVETREPVEPLSILIDRRRRRRRWPPFWLATTPSCSTAKHRRFPSLACHLRPHLELCAYHGRHESPRSLWFAGRRDMQLSGPRSLRFPAILVCAAAARLDLYSTPLLVLPGRRRSLSCTSVLPRRFSVHNNSSASPASGCRGELCRYHLLSRLFSCYNRYLLFIPVLAAQLHPTSRTSGRAPKSCTETSSTIIPSD